MKTAQELFIELNTLDEHLSSGEEVAYEALRS